LYNPDTGGETFACGAASLGKQWMDETRELAILFFAAARIASVTLVAWLVVLGSTMELARALPSAGDIVFQANETETFDIFRLDIRTGLQRTLTDGGANNLTPVWSPDGAQIAFVSDRGEGNELYVMDSNGANVRQLTANIGTLNNPSWSPDGKWIAFEAFLAATQEIYVVEVRSGTVRRLTYISGTYSQRPRWSPDGSQLAFIGDDRRDPELYLVNINGGASQRLTRNTFNDWSPEWSPDGRWLVYFTNADANLDVYALEVASGEIVRLTYHMSRDWLPTWSPDGRNVAFVSERSGIPAMYVTDMACLERDDCGDSAYPIGSAIPIDEPGIWSPDGTRVMFMSAQDDGYELYLADIGCVMLETGCPAENTRRLTHSRRDERSVAWRP
jgi:TolB protein